MQSQNDKRKHQDGILPISRSWQIFIDLDVGRVEPFLGQEVLHFPGVVSLNFDDIALHGAAARAEFLDFRAQLFEVDVNVA